jgi:hypothetical protein
MDSGDGVSGDELEEDLPLRLCKHQLEHEGGAFWCNLPIGHAGAHEPPPHEQAEPFKRQRAPPKRLSDEPDRKKKKLRLVRKEEDEIASSRLVSPGATANGEAGADVGGVGYEASATQRVRLESGPRLSKTPPKAANGRAVVRASLKPSGCAGPSRICTRASTRGASRTLAARRP